MSETKRPHFNPAVYLKKFQIFNNHGFVYSCTRTDGRWSSFTRPMSIENICEYPDLYTIVSPGLQDRDSMEISLNRLAESNYESVSEKLINFPFLVYLDCQIDKLTILSLLDQQKLVKFINLQHKRSPKWRNRIREDILNNTKLKKKFKVLHKGSLNFDFEKIASRIAHDAYTKHFLPRYFDVNVWDEALESLDWILWINDTDLPFITSDDPVVDFSEINRQGVGTMFFPISPRYGLEIYLGSQKNRHISFNFAEKRFVNFMNLEFVAKVLSSNKGFNRIVSNNKIVIRDYVEMTKNIEAGDKIRINKEDGTIILVGKIRGCQDAGLNEKDEATVVK